MKEFMYAMGLCLLMMSIWSFSKIPSDEAISQAEPSLVQQLEHDRTTLKFVSGGALVLSLACGLVGWRSRSREDANKKSVE